MLLTLAEILICKEFVEFLFICWVNLFNLCFDVNFLYKKRNKKIILCTTENFHQSAHDKYEGKLRYTSRCKEQIKRVNGIINKLDYKN